MTRMNGHIGWWFGVTVAALVVALTAPARAQQDACAGIHWRMIPPLANGANFRLTSDYGSDKPYYLDRDYTFFGFQEPLAGGCLLMTFNNIKFDSLVPAQERDTWRCLVWVDKPKVVYLLWDSRTAGHVPWWVYRGNWDLTPLVQETTDWSMGYFVVLRRVLVPGDTLELGHPMADQVGSSSMYVVIFKAIEGVGSVPTGYELRVPYPNPASREAHLTYSLLDRSWVTIWVYDALGREVAKPVDGIREPGVYNELWNLTGKDGALLPSGVYILRLRAGPFWHGYRRFVIYH